MQYEFMAYEFMRCSEAQLYLQGHDLVEFWIAFVVQMTFPKLALCYFPFMLWEMRAEIDSLNANPILLVYSILRASFVQWQKANYIHCMRTVQRKM